MDKVVTEESLLLRLRDLSLVRPQNMLEELTRRLPHEQVVKMLRALSEDMRNTLIDAQEKTRMYEDMIRSDPYSVVEAKTSGRVQSRSTDTGREAWRFQRRSKVYNQLARIDACVAEVVSVWLEVEKLVHLVGK